MKQTLTFLLLLAAIVGQAQDTYRNEYNPYYWKNRSPKGGYWQQDVHYSIKAKLDDASDIVDASEVLTYYNNSPDTLKEIFFHLYQNAFQPESYLAKLEKANGVKSKFGRHESQKLGTAVESVSIDGQVVQTWQDNTILGVKLSNYILPGKSIEISIKFKSYFDT
ncbi:MAG: M1 family peptidase, partial [Bacteroidetes bacterium]|nr:M1 family peptidase [Bacteroidota bacterium]